MPPSSGTPWSRSSMARAYGSSVKPTLIPSARSTATPVITCDRGAAPEIVSDQRTGFVVEDVDGMAEAVSRVKEIDPALCRAHVARHFDGPIMARNYVRLYRSIIEDRPLARTVPATQFADPPR